MMVLLTLIALLLPGCYRYNTHRGRVGGANSPSPLPGATRPAIPAVQFGSVPKSTIPDLLQPITRTVWIKGHQRPNGDYVGDYPLTCVFQKGEFVTQPAPDVLIPHALHIPDDTAPKASAADNPVQHAVTPMGVPPGPAAGTQPHVPHVTDYMKALQDAAEHAGPVAP
jgi:hypothetical protein